MRTVPSHAPAESRAPQLAGGAAHLNTQKGSCIILYRIIYTSRRPRRYLCGSPPVASASRRRARETAPG